jgi:4'-phosphopantetheinyl transferase EntD
VVVTDGADVPDESSVLFPEEAASLRDSVPSRRRDFTLGRWCARQALEALGISPAALPVGPHRMPVWPRGVVGSITHCAGFVGAVVAPEDQVRAIGFDAEPALPLDADLVSFICTAEEISWIAAARRLDGADWAKVIFSAKESVQKCVTPLAGRTLEFVDVRLRMHPERGAFGVESANAAATAAIDLAAFTGRIAVTDGLVLTSTVVGRT